MSEDLCSAGREMDHFRGNVCYTELMFLLYIFSPDDGKHKCYEMSPQVILVKEVCSYKQHIYQKSNK